MTCLQIADSGEPRSGAEMIAKYRAARQRLYSASVATPKQKTPIRARVQTDPATVAQTLPNLAKIVKRVDVTTEKFLAIVRVVSDRTGVSTDDILSHDKHAPIVAARQEAVWAVKTITNWSLPEVGRRFKRDHTTILHAMRRIEERATADADLRAFMDSVKIDFC